MKIFTKPFYKIFKIGFFSLAVIIIILQFLNFPSTDLGILSIGIGLLSIGIAAHSCELAMDSDEKMKLIASSTFMEIYEHIQRDFLELQDRLYSNTSIAKNQKIRNFIWNYQNGLKRALILKEYANFDDQNNMILPLKTLLERLPLYKHELDNSVVEVILKLYLLSNEFKKDPSVESELNKLIQNNFIKTNKKDYDLTKLVKQEIQRLKKNPFELYIKKD